MVNDSDPDGGILRIPGRSRCAVIGSFSFSARIAAVLDEGKVICTLPSGPPPC
jgi:hypothetical protein